MEAVGQHDHRQDRAGSCERDLRIQQQEQQREIGGGQQPGERGVAQHPEVTHKQGILAINAPRCRGQGHSEHAPLARLQRHYPRRSRNRRRDQARPVRHGEVEPRQRSAVAQAILGIRDRPIGRAGSKDCHSSASASASPPVCCSTRWRATSSPAWDRSVVLSRPSRRRAEAWMVAGGVGLAPFVTLTEALQERGTKTTLFYGARTGAELFYLDWFTSRGVRVVLSTEDGSQRRTRARHGPARTRAPPTSGDVMIYACGPEKMLEAVSHVAAKYKRPAQVSVERVMGCGMGGCYSCVIPVREAGRRSSLRALVSGRSGVHGSGSRLGP